MRLRSLAVPSSRFAIAVMLSSLPCLFFAASCGDEDDGGGGTGGSGWGGGHGAYPGLSPGGLGTDWHPDPDDDGILSTNDDCPYVYDPEQKDDDGDGIGNACDRDFAPPPPDGAITDLHAEHVTPFGGWFSFTSPVDYKTSEWGWNPVALVWTTDAGELGTTQGVRKIRDRGDVVEFPLSARYGTRLDRPIVLYELEPDTTYHLAVRKIEWDETIGPAGNVLTIRTKPKPVVTLASGYPRAWATPEIIESLRQRHASSEGAFKTWREAIDYRLARAPGSGEIEQMKWCASAALLFSATGDPSYEDTARKLFEELTSYWEDNELEFVEHRGADAGLAVCLDLLWGQLSPSERERAIKAYLGDDEAYLDRFDTDPDFPERLDDTDALASLARVLVVDGVVGCNAPGVNGALSNRSCAVLDQGLRRFYGVELPKMRRDRGFFAMSGGSLPDGIDYGQQTSKYSMQTFWALWNVGLPAGEYAAFILNNFLAMFVYDLTPTAKGFSSWGDLSDFMDNWEIEPNSFPRMVFQADTVAWHTGLLSRLGLMQEAGWARWTLRNLFEQTAYSNREVMLMFDTDAVPEVDYKKNLPLILWDSGMGLLFDRTSWSDRASFMVLRAGWAGVDHSQEEQGHFQLFRSGRWITHESLSYDGEAATSAGHNVPLLEIRLNNDEVRFGQYTLTGGAAPDRVIRASASPSHLFAVEDLTGNYNSARYLAYDYNRVERTILWWKPADEAGADAVVVYDFVDGVDVPSGTSRRWQVHLDGAPSIDGNRATIDLPSPFGEQTVEITALIPSTTSLATLPPNGTPGEDPQPVYTHRLVGSPVALSEVTHSVFVIQAANSGDDVPTPVAIDLPAFVGVQIGSNLALFPRTGVESEVGGLTEAQVTLEARAPVMVYWSGFQPVTGYTVAGTGTGTVTFDVALGGAVKTDRAGVLRFGVGADGKITSM